MKLEDLFTLENMNNAFYKCAKISHWKDSTQRYKENLLINNVNLQNEILSGTYKISHTIDFKIVERGKERQIHAPVIRDRIVQKVLCDYVLIPELSKPLIYDNYASIKGRGTSFARKRLCILLNRYISKYGSDGYILQIDIKKYFDSINHDILKSMIHSRINESEGIMNLIDYIIDTSSEGNVGLNLGAEAPQIFSLYYLSGIDSYIKTVRGFKYYGRYMDDMFVLSNDKNELSELLKIIKNMLLDLDIEVNERKTHITKLGHGFTFMQIKYNIDNEKIIKRPSHNKIVRERRRLKKYKRLYDSGEMNEDDIYKCYKSWRNNIIKDCNSCHRTIQSMDSLYRKLFPIHNSKIPDTRESIIRTAYAEYGHHYIENEYIADY